MSAFSLLCLSSVGGSGFANGRKGVAFRSDEKVRSIDERTQESHLQEKAEARSGQTPWRVNARAEARRQPPEGGDGRTAGVRGRGSGGQPC